jgi:hypothetical protein
MLLTFVSAAVVAADNRGFTATLNACNELIGFGPVPFAAARALVPASYTLPQFGPSTAGLVVRVARCGDVRVDNSSHRPAVVAQVGIAVVPPDGTGDINNYTLLYSTDNESLAGSLRDAGLPAILDRSLTTEFSPDSTGNGEVYAAVSPGIQPAWFLTGTAGPPPPGGAPVVANWWFNVGHSVLKMATSIPSISYGPANLVLHTSRLSVLGALIGGNTDASFVLFSGRGVFDAGSLTVTLH